MTHTSITHYLPLNISVGTTDDNRLNCYSLANAINKASSEHYIIYIDSDDKTLFKLNCYGLPIDTLSDMDKVILQYLTDAEGDDVK
jgi:hypothetical protein